MPTLEEINAAAPDTPVFILHLYCRALAESGGAPRLRLHEGHAESARRRNPARQGGQSHRPAHRAPERDDSLRHARQRTEAAAGTPIEFHAPFHARIEPARLTSIIDAGGGFQNYPEDYAIIEELHQRGEMTLRIAYNLFTQKPGGEGGLRALVEDREPDKGDDISAATARAKCSSSRRRTSRTSSNRGPILSTQLEGELEGVVGLLAEQPLAVPSARHLRRKHHSLPERLREVNRDVPLKGLNWFFDHCETISDRNSNA